MTSKRETRQFIVSVPWLDDVSEADWKAYILDAVGSMKGCYNPDDPVTRFDSDEVRIKRHLPNRLPQAHQMIRDKDQHIERLKEQIAILRRQMGEQPLKLIGS